MLLDCVFYAIQVLRIDQQKRQAIHGVQLGEQHLQKSRIAVIVQMGIDQLGLRKRHAGNQKSE